MLFCTQRVQFIIEVFKLMHALLIVIVHFLAVAEYIIYLIIYSHYVSSFCVHLHGNSNTLVTSTVWHYGVWVAILWCRAHLIRLM